MKKQSFWCLFWVSLSTTVFLQACGQQATDSTVGQSNGRTALDYAYECEAVLGPLPDFNYEDAVEIPVTKEGISLTQASDNDSEKKSHHI